jgi:intracellular sulfur oxidation DsrE/DsrF family protein
MRKTCRSLFVFLFAIICSHTLKANNAPVLKDTLTEEQKDSIHEATLQATMSYPYIKSSKESGVLPVLDIDEKQDPNLQYKLLFFMSGVDKNKMKKLNDGLSEIARAINLHAAAGIPVANIHAVVIVFMQGLNVLLKDEKYLEKYKSVNPNIILLEELQKAGVKFITCGQSMARIGVKKEDMIPNAKVSLSARTAISYYETIGYVEQ